MTFHQNNFFCPKQITNNLDFKDITSCSLSKNINCRRLASFANYVNLIKKLGSGGFGAVYLACWKSKKFALKILHRKHTNLMTSCLKAERLSLNFDHPNIVRTIMVNSFWTGYENGLILMEYIGERNLQCLIDDSKEVLCYNRRMKFCKHVSKAMEYIHSKNVVHLDLKPTNIIIADNDVCKICDFGCCRYLKWPIVEEFTLSGTAAYIAPELLKGTQPTEKCDVYSFGIILWQMLSREAPFEYENPHVIIFRVVTENIRPKEIDSGKAMKDLEYVSLYKRCWSTEPHNRPNFEELVDIYDILVKS